MCSLHDRAEIQLMLALITNQSTNLYNVWQLLKIGVKVTITNKDITYSTVDKKLWKSIFDSNKTGTIKHLAKYLCSVRLHYIFSMEPSVDFRVAQWVSSLDLTTQTSLSPVRRGFAPSFVNYKKGCTRLAATSDKVYQLLAHGRWFSPGIPASSTTKTVRHDIAEILLKVALNTKIQIPTLWNLLTNKYIDKSRFTYITSTC